MTEVSNLQIYPDEKIAMQILSDRDCPAHIFEHSIRVSQVGVIIAQNLRQEVTLDVEFVRSACLLHDVMKMPCIEQDCSHAEEGARLMVQLGFPMLGNIIRQHVYLEDLYGHEHPITAAHILNYADKRVRHSTVVTLHERFEYLFERYGVTESRLKRLQQLFHETLFLEEVIFARCDLSPESLIELNQAHL